MEKVKIWQPAFSNDILLSHSDYDKFCFEPHVHQDFHIGLIEQGSQTFFHKGKTHQLGPGAISLLNPDEVHDGAGPESGYKVRVFNLPPSWLAGQLGGENYFKHALSDDPMLYQQLLILHQWLEREPDNPALEGQLLQLLSLSLQRHGETVQTDKQHKLSASQLAYVKDYLLANLEYKVSLEQMAELLGLSKFQFLRQFKQAVGVTPHAYLTQLRVEMSKVLLCSGINVIQAGQQVGFYDQSHFNKAFKRAFGIAPSRMLKIS